MNYRIVKLVVYMATGVWLPDSLDVGLCSASPNLDETSHLFTAKSSITFSRNFVVVALYLEAL